MKQVFSEVVTVLSASRYSFQDEEEKGRMVEGCKIQYVRDWDGEDSQNRKGIDIIVGTLDFADFEGIQHLPADFNASFSMRVNGKGKPMLHLDSLEYVQGFRPFSASVSPNTGKSDKHG